MTAWFDLNQLTAGESISSQLAQGIQQSEYFLCFITQKYSDSKNWVLELTFASTLHKRIIPVMLEEIKMQDLGSVGFIISTCISINYFESKNKEELLRSIKREIEVCKKRFLNDSILIIIKTLLYHYSRGKAK